MTDADKTPTPPKRNGQVSIPVREVLEHADVYALRTFLRQETKRNNVLSIKLKAHLIECITNDGDRNRYESVLKELIKTNERGIVPLAKRDTKLVTDVCNIFLNKSRVALADKAYRESFDAIFGMLNPLQGYVGKSKEDVSEIEELLSTIYTELHRLLRAELAPELRDDIYKAGLELVEKSYYRPLTIDTNLLSALLLARSEKDKVSGLFTMLGEKMARQSDTIIYGFWYAVIADSCEEQLDTILLHQVLQPSEIFNIARHLDERGLISARNHWAASFEIAIDSQSQRGFQWRQWKFDAFLTGLDSDNMLEVGLSLLTDTQELEYFDSLKKKFSTKVIVDHLLGSGSEALVTDILVHVGKWRQFEKLMVRLGDLDLVTRHIDAILANVKDPVDFLTRILQDYLIHHAGHLCSERLNGLLLALDAKGHFPLSEELKTDIQRAFPGRFKFTEVGLNISY